MRLLLIGCSGFIGKELVPHLLNEGHHVTLLSRKEAKKFDSIANSNNLEIITIDPVNETSWGSGQLLTVLEKADGVINLAGEPIAEKRWTNAHCETIKNSRIYTTKNLIKAINKINKPPKILINASAIGYYGTSINKHFTENSSSGNDFLAHLCKEWELITHNKPRKTRLLIIRIGIVIESDGGALKKMLPIFKAGLGGPIGDGKQWMSWVHRTDLCRMINIALTNNAWTGVINGVAPNPIIMSEFSNTLGKILGRPSLIAVPAPLLKLLLGDGAKVVLQGQHVKSENLQRLGFEFKYPLLNQALAAATKKKNQ